MINSDIPLKLYIFVFAAMSCFGAGASEKTDSPLTGSTQAKLPAKPNIILVMTDDQGYGQLGCQGHPWLETPNIDKLCKQSTVFTDFHVSPTCSPTRAALLTGNVPFKNGVTHTVKARHRLALSAVTLPQYLKKAGYTSGIFGKWHLGLEEKYQPGARGFDEVFVHGYGAIGQGLDVPKNKYHDPVIRHNGTFVKTKGFCTDVFFSQALGWIRQNRNRPFFAYISTNAPHSPFVAPDHKMEKFSQYGFKEGLQGFYGMIENIDENVGRLMACLKEWELEENTLVIFMSDNGYPGVISGKVVTHGSRNGQPLKSFHAGLKGSKKTPNEGGTKVPAFFRWKGVLQEGVDCNALAAHIDMLPTLVEIAGGEVPKDIDGKSLLPLLKNSDAPWDERNLFFHIGRWRDGKADQSKYDKIPGKTGFAVRNMRYRLVNHDELYDILSDPGETKNIYGQKPEVVQEMQDAYDKWWDEVRPYMVNEGKEIGPNPYHEKYKEQLDKEGVPSWEKPAL
jgi:arylsulfatase